MQKRMFTWTTIAVLFTFSFSPQASAYVIRETTPTQTEETPATSEPTLVEAYADLDEEDEENPEGIPVSQAENSVEKARKKEFWRNIILATSAVIVAIVSILVVSNNNGKNK